MTQTEVIQQLASAIGANIRPPIPVDIDIWSSKEIAEFLKYSETQVMNRIVCLPSFPCAIRLPTGESKRGNPRWEAQEVIEWAKKFKEKKK